MRGFLEQKFNQAYKFFESLNSEQLFFLYLGIMYIVFIIFDILQIFPVLSAALKYASIAACLVYVVNKKRHDFDLVLALFFTVIADTILVWTHYETIGVIIFCFAQFFHCKRIHNLHVCWIFAFALFITAVLTFCHFSSLVPIYTIAAVYGFMLIFNLVSAITYSRKNTNPAALYLKYGFIAFVCCDSCVALRHIILDGYLPEFFLPASAFLVWVFYLPSQALLSHSSFRLEKLPKAQVSDKLDI